MKIVSACLAGVNCRYDGKSCENSEIIDLIRKGEAIPVCPEQLGGLPTPRPPAEIQTETNKIINIEGSDVTQNYNQGAVEALKIAKLMDCKKAILKSNSPMCGCGKIYDGTFSGNFTKGDGVFTKLLKLNNIQITTK